MKGHGNARHKFSERWTPDTPYGIYAVSSKTFSFGDLGAIRQTYRNEGFAEDTFRVTEKQRSKGLHSMDGCTGVDVIQWGWAPSEEQVGVWIADVEKMVSSNLGRKLRNDCK